MRSSPRPLFPPSLRLAALLALTSPVWFFSPMRTASAANNMVKPGDTYSIEVVGYDTNDPAGNIYVVQPGLDPTFGTTQTYANAALGGQTLTVTSTESFSNGFTFDRIGISVPTNFLPTGTLDNHKNVINALEFSIGDFQGGTDPLDFVSAPPFPSSTGDIVINIGGGAQFFALAQNQTLSNGGASYSNEEAGMVPVGTSISVDNATGFDVTIVYATAPEPSTVAALLLGGGLLGGTVWRRRAARV